MAGVSFHELAERELNDAALYYERESAGLGLKFLDEDENYIDAIVKNPNAGKRVRGQVRRRILRKFPYGILYSVREGTIRVLGVFSPQQAASNHLKNADGPLARARTTSLADTYLPDRVCSRTKPASS